MWNEKCGMRNETARNVEGCGMKNVEIEMRAWGALTNSE
jgi:hypothetical protein